MLVTSFSSIRPFTSTVLQLFKLHLGYFHSDTDAKFRNEVISNTKHLIERLRGATALLVRELEQASFKLTQLSMTDEKDERKSHDSIASLLLSHQQIIEWYAEFLLDELVPTASYQRHITALRAIQLLLNSHISKESFRRGASMPASSTVWPFTIELFDARSVRLLLDLLMDPFEDVRTGAMVILTLCPPESFTECSSSKSDSNAQERHDEASNGASPGFERPESQSGLVASMKRNPLPLLTEFIARANQASMNSGRADYADGVARAYKLLHSLQPSIGHRMKLIEGLVTDLEDKVVAAEQDLAQAVVNSPVHGNFAALR